MANKKLTSFEEFGGRQIPTSGSSFEEFGGRSIGGATDRSPSLIDIAKATPIGQIYSKAGSFSKETVSNIPKSGVEFGKGIYTAFRHPIETAKSVGQVALGGAEKLIPGEQEQEQSFDAVTDFFKQRYGGIENLKNTIKNDPVGFAADLSIVLGGAGAISSKVPQLGKVGSVLTKASEITDPLRTVTSTVSKTGDIIGAGGKRLLSATTRTGSDIIQAAYEQPKSALKQMYGVTSESKIVEDATSALEGIKEKRRIDYVSKLDKIKQNPATFEKSFFDLNENLDKLLESFNIKLNPDGKLDFSRAPISGSGQTKIEEAVNVVKSWGDQPGDFNAKGLDILKRKLDDLTPDTGAAQAFITPLKKKVRQTLVDNVPGYESMVKGYEESSNLIDDVKKTFSLTDTANVDSSLRKLTNSLKGNNEFKRDLIKQLEEVGKSDLTGRIAGQQLSPILPKTMSQYLAISGTGALVYKGLLHPYYLAALAMASPRTVGTFVAGLGLGKELSNKLIFEAKKYGALNPNIYKGAYQAGRIEKETREKQ